MGLDQYAYKIDAELVDQDCETDFEGVNPKKWEMFHDWRKHANLQGWMEQLYQDKGGYKTCFNCVKVKLSFTDLEKLKEDVLANKLPNTTGFFFGESTADDMLSDLEFIKNAKELIKEGHVIAYDSWW